jgi:acetylornithine deacetylase
LSRAADILRELVAIPSVSSMSNRPVIEAAERLLAASGWASRLLPYRDGQGVEKLNLIARPSGQNASAIDLAFVCHTDTVPFDLHAWPEATSLSEREGMLHGCGACDVKGSLAGILAAIARTAGENIARGVALILTADEEIGCVGATKLLADETLRINRVLVCEPTSLRPAVAGKGYGLAEVRVAGKEAHSAFPQQGASAIYTAAQMMLAIRDRTEQAQNALFDPPHTTFNVGIVQGGTAKNIIPGECHFLVEWRPLPEENPDAAIEWLKELASEAEQSNSGCVITVEALRADAGFASPADSPFVGALSRMLGRQATGISFGSEATRFARIADEVVVMGPGNMHTAHSDRECIPVAELEMFAECVAGLLTAAPDLIGSHPSR